MKQDLSYLKIKETIQSTNKEKNNEALHFIVLIFSLITKFI